MSFLVFAQDEAKTFLLNSYKYNTVVSETDPLGNSYYCFMHKSNFEIKILDKNLNLTGGRIFKVKDYDRNKYPIGIGYASDYMFVYFLDVRLNKITRLIFDKKNIMVPRFSETAIFLPRTERYLEAVNVKGKFKIVSFDKITNHFVVRTPSSQTDSAEVKYITSGSEMLERVLQNGEKDISLKRMYSYSDNLQNTASLGKVYLEDDELRITIDDRRFTHLFELNLVSNICKYSKLVFHLHRCNDGDIEGGNSHIKNNKLFKITYCAGMMNLATVELDSLSIEQTYNIFPDKEVDIKCTPFIEEVSYEDRNDTKDYLSSTDEFMERLNPDGLGIAVCSLNENDFLLQIGSSRTTFYTVTSPGYGNTFGMGGGISIGGFGLGSGSPSVFGSPTMNTYRKVKDVYFKSIINQETLSRSANIMPEPAMSDKLSSFENAKVNDSFKGVSTINEVENEIIYGYFSGKDDLYHLVKFKQ
jgi:hypothetical protein